MIQCIFFRTNLVSLKDIGLSQSAHCNLHDGNIGTKQNDHEIKLATKSRRVSTSNVSGKYCTDMKSFGCTKKNNFHIHMLLIQW